MAMEVVLQNERCDNISEMVHDPTGVIIDCLPDPAGTSYSCARFIDPYGDTVFNRLQAAALIGEWDRLRQSFSDRNAETLWADIRRLIVQCSGEPHTYMKFVGD